MSQITVLGFDAPRTLMSPEYRVLLPQEGESIEGWRSRLGFTVHVQSMGSLTWYQDSQAPLHESGRYHFVQKYSKQPMDLEEYVKVPGKPKYLLVFKHPAPYDNHVEAAFANSSTELATARAHFMPLVNYIELRELSKRLLGQEERLDKVSDSIRMIAANFSDLLVKEMNRKDQARKRRSKGGRRG